MNLYLAYGSNLNLQQMAQRCPDSYPVAKTILKDFELVFRGEPTNAYATLERKKGCEVPVLLWDITTKQDKINLDIYEDCFQLYHIEELNIQVQGETKKVFMYLMRAQSPLGLPSNQYYQSIYQGYVDNGYDTKILDTYLESQKEKMKQELQ